MNDYVKRLDFDSDTFEQMKTDMNFVLQRLLGNMLEKGTNEGNMTIKIEVTMVKEFIPNYDPDVEGESREVSKPQFKHKVTSAVKINDEKSGKYDTEMELVLNEYGVYELRPIANTQQRSIFDSDFKPNYETKEDDEGTIIDGGTTPLLPGPNEEDEENEPEYEEDAGELGEDLEDITDKLLGYDAYRYDDPDKDDEGSEE